MDEILPGVWHWTTVHPNLQQPVSSYSLEDAGAAVDPLLPEGGVAAFGDWAVQKVILTNRHHSRDAAQIREARGATILVPRPGLHEYEGSELEVEPYYPGDEVAPGVRVHELAAISPDDFVLHVSAGLGALVFADGVINMNGIGFVPDGLMDDPERVRARTFERLHELVQLDFDALLFAHGDPIPSGGRDALLAFIAAEAS